MGRRALRRIPQTLDLTPYQLALDQPPGPWSAEATFGGEAALEVEVGTGKGLFLAGAAAAHPERNYLGIEISRKYARFAAAKLAWANNSNAKVLHGDALRFFALSLHDATVAAVHVYFPDPWWKKRHKKRRVMNEAFLRDVQRTLTPDGVLHFWTDVREYYETTLDLIDSVTQLDGPFEVDALPAEHELDYRTHFERRMRLHEEPVYRAEFRKKAIDE